MKERKTRITVETHEVLVIKERGNLYHVWCARCGKQTAVISLNDACMSGLTADAAQRQVETGRLHLIEIGGGLSFVCLDSLVRAGSIDQDNSPPANSIHRILNQSEREENHE
ncbi:MAG TPA: hypothetical protein VGV87_27660 [Blastocatellia bacterium]|nr:hypothetical protein [Blastocatellia bacterium]